MYGLEKKGRPLFEFDLEKDLKKDPNKARAILQAAEGKIQELKGIIRDGSKSAEVDNLGTLLHGYTALQKVLNKLANKK